MEAALFIGGLMALATIIMFLPQALHNKDKEMSRQLEIDRRTKRLLNEAQARYPQDSQIDAISQFITDLEDQIVQLKKSAINTDVLFVVRETMEDKQLLMNERAYLCSLEVNKSQFSILHSAQV